MTFNKQLLTAAILAAGGFAAISSANAAIEDTFDITLTVASVCDITAGSAVDIDFGTADNTVKSGTNAIEVFCSTGTDYQLALTPSNGDTSGLGVLTGPGGEIEYKLTQGSTDAAWGNIVGTNTLDSVGTGAYNANSHGVTVTTTSTTDLAVGDYADIVTIDLTF